MLFYSGKVFGQWWPTISVCLKVRDFSAYRAFGAKTRTVSGKLGWLVTPCGPPITFSKFSWRRGPSHPSLFCPTDFSDSYSFTACSFILPPILWSKPWAQSSKKNTSLKDSSFATKIWECVLDGNFGFCQSSHLSLHVHPGSKQMVSLEGCRFKWRTWFSYHGLTVTCGQDKNENPQLNSAFRKCEALRMHHLEALIQTFFAFLSISIRNSTLCCGHADTTTN